MSEYILILPAVFAFLAYRNRHNLLACSLYAFYTLGSFTGYVLTQQSLYPDMENSGYQPISWQACLYLLVGCLILFYPVTSQTPPGIISSKVNDRNFSILAYIFIFISFIFIGLAIPKVSNVMNNVVDFTAIKEDVMDEGFHLSDISIVESLIANQIILRPFFAFLFMYALCRIDGYRNMKICLGIAVFVTPLVHATAAAHRNIAVFAFLDVAVAFLVFYKTFPKKIRKTFIIGLGAVGGAVLLITVLFAVFRFTDGREYVEYSLYRYLGEPFVDFNTLLWNTDTYTNGHKSFDYVRSLLGMSYYENNVAMRDSFNAPYPVYYFYSIIGSFYMDFGPSMTMILLAAISIIFTWLLRCVFKRPALSFYMLLFLYTAETIRNYFYFSFMGMNNLIFIKMCIFYLVIVLFLRPAAPDDRLVIPKSTP